MSRHLFRLVAALVLVPVVYLLAMGPLWGLAMRDRDWGAWLNTAIMLYDPVVWIAERHPAFDRCISAYVEQWCPQGSGRGSITLKQVGGGSPAPGLAP